MQLMFPFQHHAFGWKVNTKGTPLRRAPNKEHNRDSLLKHITLYEAHFSLLKVTNCFLKRKLPLEQYAVTCTYESFEISVKQLATNESFFFWYLHALSIL